MPLIANSSGYVELIFLLLVILFQLIATILNKLNEKKQRTSAPPRKDFKSEPQSPAPPQKATPPPQEAPNIEQELRELLEALGMEPPQEVEKKTPPIATTPKPSTTPNSSPPPVTPHAQRAPSPAAFEVKVMPPKKEVAPTTTPNPPSKPESIAEAIKFNVAPLLQPSPTTTVRNTSPPTSSYADLKKLLKNRNEARRGILIAEILGKPLSLR